MKLDLKTINLLAQLADPSYSLACLGQDSEDKNRLAVLLQYLLESASILNETQEHINRLRTWSRLLQSEEKEIELINLYHAVRQYILRKQWLAVIIPSATDQETKHFFADPDLLRFNIRADAKSSGIVLHLQQVPAHTSTLLHTHNTLTPLINDSLDWPGLLIIIPGSDSVFLPLSSPDALEFDLEARLQWLFNHLLNSQTPDTGVIKTRFSDAFPEVFSQRPKTFHILHLSNIFLGKRSTAFRLQRLKHCIRSLIEELGEDNTIQPVITGNLLASPSEEHIEITRSFWQFLSSMGTQPPLFSFGSCDVRQDGNINDNYRTAIEFQNAKVSWFDAENIAIINLNTVVNGNQQHGSIGAEQIEIIDYEIKRKQTNQDFKFIILMHHSPVTNPSYRQHNKDFYQKISGPQTEAGQANLENSQLLSTLIEQYPVIALLHSHPQEPCISSLKPSIPAIGCGHSIGIQSQMDGQIYFSINSLSINTETNKLSTRLYAVKMPQTENAGHIKHTIIQSDYLL